MRNIFKILEIVCFSGSVEVNERGCVCVCACAGVSVVCVCLCVCFAGKGNDRLEYFLFSSISMLS